MAHGQFTNQAIIARIQRAVALVLAYTTFDNVYCAMLIAIGVGTLLRPQHTSLIRLAEYAHTQVSIELYAGLFIGVGAYGLNRTLTKPMRIWLAAPFILHTLLTWLVVALRNDVGVVPAFIYVAICVWIVDRE